MSGQKHKDEDVNCEDQETNRSGPDEDQARSENREQAGDNTTKSDR